MAYRAFRESGEQEAAEEQDPAAFDAGDVWLSLAERALTATPTRVFQQSEFTQLSGIDAGAIQAPITATQAWELRPDYEDARLRATYVSLAGIDAAEEKERQYAGALRAARGPDEIKGLRLALYVLRQALTDPDKRAPWSKLLRANDLERAAFYRAGAERAVETTADKLARLRPRQCVVITEAEANDFQRTPRPGFFIESFRMPGGGGRGLHICRGEKSTIGFRAR